MAVALASTNSTAEEIVWHCIGIVINISGCSNSITVAVLITDGGASGSPNVCGSSRVSDCRNRCSNNMTVAVFVLMSVVAAVLLLDADRRYDTRRGPNLT